MYNFKIGALKLIGNEKMKKIVDIHGQLTTMNWSRQIRAQRE